MIQNIGIAAAAGALLAGCGADENPRPVAATSAKAEPKVVRDDGAVTTVEAVGDVVQGRIRLGTNETCGVVAHEGRVYVVVNGKRRLLAVDPSTGKVARRYRLPGDPCVAGLMPGAMLFDVGDRLIKLDLDSGRVVGSARADRGCGGAAVDGSSVWWTTDRTSQRVGRFAGDDLRPTGRVEGVGSIGAGPCDLTFGGGAVWAGNDDSTVQRIDPATDKVVKTYEAGPQPSFLTWHPDGFLLYGTLNRSVFSVLEPESGATTNYMVGGGPMAIDGSDLYTLSAYNGGESQEKPPPLVWKVDLRAKKVTARVRVGSDAPPRDASERVPPPMDGTAVAGGSLWVVNTTDQALYQIDLSKLG